MNQELLAYLTNLLGIDGYIIRKPENTPYPAFVISNSISRDLPIYANQGKPMGYTFGIQINLIGNSYRSIHSHSETIIDALDGFSGDIGGVTVIDSTMNGYTEFQNSNKNFELVIDFTVRSLN
ncbi:MAG: hypothetical protein COA84_14070 [Robiginitomaculum sp.]|nr:MAG: hypothetical protein COA84_14070 [Robiginitomaculum sp.]